MATEGAVTQETSSSKTSQHFGSGQQERCLVGFSRIGKTLPIEGLTYHRISGAKLEAICFKDFLEHTLSSEMRAPGYPPLT